jgi:hypothetical protein
MSIAVNAHLVIAGDNLAQPTRVTLYLFSTDEESSARRNSFQDFEEVAKSLIWPVVEGQRHRVVIRLDPNDPRKEKATRPTPRSGRNVSCDKGCRG